VTELSIVMPVWNEEAVVGALVEDLDREVLDRLDSAELIVVDDASTDATPEILDALAQQKPRLRVVRSERNRGHGPSVVHGLTLADADWVFQLDSDGQFVIGDFWELWRHREGADLVLGVRVDRQDPLHRLLLTRVIAVTVSALVGRRLRDPNTPFRLARQTLVEDVRPLLGPSTLAPSIYVAAAAAVRGWRVAEVPVTHRRRAGGTSSLRRLRLLRFALRGLLQLLAFRVRLARHPRPPRPAG
jgi:glycosyltransferase involved in cell wall biosynthesis